MDQFKNGTEMTKDEKKIHKILVGFRPMRETCGEIAKLIGAARAETLTWTVNRCTDLVDQGADIHLIETADLHRKLYKEFKR